MSANADFRYATSWEDIAREAEAIQPGITQVLLPIIHALEERDRTMVDFLNEAVRREAVANVAGDGSAHVGTAWQTIVPTVGVDFTKAHDRSQLVVAVATNGRYTLAGGGWIEFGVRLLDLEGNLVGTDSYPVVRREFEAVQSADSFCAVGFVALTDIPKGAMTVRVRVRGSAAGASWGSETNGTNSLFVSESR